MGVYIMELCITNKVKEQVLSKLFKNHLPFHFSCYTYILLLSYFGLTFMLPTSKEFFL